jgi:hypothetical protein
VCPGIVDFPCCDYNQHWILLFEHLITGISIVVDLALMHIFADRHVYDIIID